MRRRLVRPAVTPTTCPVAELAAEYQKINDIDNETVGDRLKESDSGIEPIDGLNLRKDAAEAMAAVLPAQSIEGVLFQLGLLNELFRDQCGWHAREQAPESERPGMREAHVRAHRMIYSIRNFLWREYGLRELTNNDPQWLLPVDDDPFVEEAKLWAEVGAERRKKGGAS